MNLRGLRKESEVVCLKGWSGEIEEI